jgi:dUTP pyrophosphatase
MAEVKVKLLSENGNIPTKGTPYAAGFDLYAAESATVHRLGRKLVKTNISLEIPEGFYGRIAPRSGLALKSGIDIMAGVVDSDYRGDIGVIMYNTDNNVDFNVNIGDKIAQIIIEPYLNTTMSEVSNADQLSATARGEKGYGHTG